MLKLSYELKMWFFILLGFVMAVLSEVFINNIVYSIFLILTCLSLLIGVSYLIRIKLQSIRYLFDNIKNKLR